MKKAIALWAVTILLVAAFVFTMLTVRVKGPSTHDITIIARKFAFDPNIISVRRGDSVRLTLAPEDVMHGIYLDGYDIEMHAKPGGTATVSFEASRTGKFLFRCSTTCGTFHPYMIGWLRVSPNIPLALGMWASVIVTWLVIVYAIVKTRPKAGVRIAASEPTWEVNP